MASPTATLLISCQDAPAIVAGVSSLVAKHGGNILDSDQHTDVATGIFFQRLVFELDGFTLPRPEIQPAVEQVLAVHDPTVEVRFSDDVKRVAILVSKAEHCLYDLLLRRRSGELRCDVPIVLSNHAKLAPVAEHFGVPFRHVPIEGGNKLAQESELVRLLDEERIDLVVLARYMQILTAAFVERYPATINIHHSFLPAFKGARPYHQAHARGVKLIGATSHYVTEDLDQGPIIAQDVARVSHRDNVRDLIHKGRDMEKVVLARAVRWHLEDRVLTFANRTVVFV